MDFGGLDFASLLRQGGLPAGGGGLPPIKTNMAPPANFWEGNKFKIGAPGMQATPVGDPGHPATPAPPQQPAVPPTVGVGGGAFMPGVPNPFLTGGSNEQGTLGRGQAAPMQPSLPYTIRSAVPYLDPSSVQLAPSAANPYYRPGAKMQQDGYNKNPFLARMMR